MSFPGCLGPDIFMHNQYGKLKITSKIGHELYLLLKLPYGFIPSVARPSLRFLGSLPNSGYKQSVFFHCGESAGCRNNPSHILPFECHVKFFASLTLAKKRFNHGMIGRYHNTFAGTLSHVIFVTVTVIVFYFVS